MGVDFSFEGIGDLIEKLELMVAESKEIEDRALKAAATPILDEAKRTTEFHDLSGKLRKSLKISKSKKDKSGRLTIKVYSSDPVAHLIEYGHAGPAPAPPHAFLRAAFNRNKTEAQEIIRKMISEALAK